VIRESGLADRVHVMVRSGNLHPWKTMAPEIALIQSRNGPDGRRGRIPLEVSYGLGMRHLVVYASARGLLRRGRILAKLGLQRLGFLIGFWPGREIVDRYRARGASFVVFTVNDALLARLYLRAGFAAIGTDDPRALRGLLADPRRGHTAGRDGKPARTEA
jgi:glycerophosphoryl diester phosphodiesterase